jgi:Leucine-rich repeat (LRR) protein
LLAVIAFAEFDSAGIDAADDSHLQESVRALASDQFSRREEATKALIAAGEAAVPLAAGVATSSDREASYRGLLVLTRLAKTAAPNARRSARRALGELAKSSDPQVARVAGEATRAVAAEAVELLRSSGGEADWNNGRLWSVSFANKPVGDAAIAPIDDLEPVQLNLTRTRVTDATLARLAGHTQLELLNLMATNITDDGLKHVAGLAAMKTFSIERTTISDAALVHLTGMSNLKTLYLGGSQVSGRGLKHVERLPIEYLSFAYSTVDDSVVEHIVPIKSLKTLGLDDTKVTDACVPPLVALENLEVLWLDNCEITDAAVEHLTRLSHLKSLHIENTKISEHGFTELKDKLKGASIVGSPAR